MHICDNSYHRRDVYRCIFFSTEGDKLLRYFERIRRALEAWRNGPRSPPYRDWSGRNKRGSCQGIVPHLHDRPFVGIGQSLGIFQASRPPFAPLFSSSGPLPPSSVPSSPFHTLDLCFLFVRLWDALGLRFTLFGSGVPFSFPAFIFIIIIIVIRVSIFTSGRCFIVSAVIIIINGEEASELLHSLRFIVVYSRHVSERILLEGNSRWYDFDQVIHSYFRCYKYRYQTQNIFHVNRND